MPSPVFQATYSGTLTAVTGVAPVPTSGLATWKGWVPGVDGAHPDGSSPAYGTSYLARLTGKGSLLSYPGSNIPGAIAGDTDFSYYFTVPNSPSTASFGFAVTAADAGFESIQITVGIPTNEISLLSLQNGDSTVPYTFVGGEQIIVKYRASDGATSVEINGTIITSFTTSFNGLLPWGAFHIQKGIVVSGILGDLRIYNGFIDSSTSISSFATSHPTGVFPLAGPSNTAPTGSYNSVVQRP